MYWLILFGLVIIVYRFKIGSSGSFLLTVSLFVIAATLTLFGLDFVAEIVMRISFVSFLVGFVQALLEYLHS